MKQLLLSLSLLVSATTWAQPVMLSDAVPGANGCDPSMFTGMNGKVYFAADDGINGQELWVYDGSTCSMVYNINPSGDALGAIKQMVELNGKLYFSADDGTNGRELWVYDGINPPSIAADIEPGAGTGGVGMLAVLNNKIYFGALTTTTGGELWSYDPATNTAAVLSSLAPGADPSGVYEVGVFNGKVYFSGTTPGEGFELRVYDPANNTSSMVADINSGAPGSSPFNFMTANNKLYFFAKTINYGIELYSYSGSGIPTRLTDINPGAGDSGFDTPLPFNFMAYMNNNIYFCAQNATSGYQMFKYDIATNTTNLFYTINPSGPGTNAYYVSYANKLYFGAGNPTIGFELWTFDGTNPPAMIYDINPGSGSGGPSHMTVIGNTLYFGADNGISGDEPYKLYDPATSVATVNSNIKMALHPNPASTDAYIDMELEQAQKLSVTIADIAGKVLSNTSNKYDNGYHTISVPCGQWAQGTYIYQVKDEAGHLLHTGKLIKK